MKMDKDGKLDLWGRLDFKVLEEFGWNVEAMATEIRELREQLEDKDKEIDKLFNQT